MAVEPFTNSHSIDGCTSPHRQARPEPSIPEQSMGPASKTMCPWPNDIRGLYRRRNGRDSVARKKILADQLVWTKIRELRCNISCWSGGRTIYIQWSMTFWISCQILESKSFKILCENTSEKTIHWNGERTSQGAEAILCPFPKSWAVFTLWEVRSQEPLPLSWSIEIHKCLLCHIDLSAARALREPITLGDQTAGSSVLPRIIGIANGFLTSVLWASLNVINLDLLLVENQFMLRSHWSTDKSRVSIVFMPVLFRFVNEAPRFPSTKSHIYPIKLHVKHRRADGDALSLIWPTAALWVHWLESRYFPIFPTGQASLQRHIRRALHTGGTESSEMDDFLHDHEESRSCHSGIISYSYSWLLDRKMVRQEYTYNHKIGFSSAWV
jgi:hypothetical protein